MIYQMIFILTNFLEFLINVQYGVEIIINCLHANVLYFAKSGQKILDTHGGSMSHAIAAHKLGFDLTIIEKDPVYYEQAKKRLIEF